jgi:hypothetical protein
MKRLLIRATSLAFLLGLVYLAVAADKPGPAAGKDAKEEKPTVFVTISKETTYITGPLRKDGYVNYVAAINQQTGKGVTPDNNSAVPFLKAMGPGEIDAKHRAEYFRLLGIDPLPEKGDYYLGIGKYVERMKVKRPAGGHGDLSDADFYEDQRSTAMQRPWTKQEFPVLDAWLAANEKPLALLVDASKRPRRFDPLVPEDGSMIASLLPAISSSREGARALATRAMLRAGEGNAPAAWDDLLACHRLSRLAGQGTTLVDALVAIALDGIACRGDQGLLQLKLTPSQVAAMRADLDRLPPLPHMQKLLSSGERFCFLDSVNMMARDGCSGMTDLAGGGKKEKGLFETIANSVGRRSIDWDLILRMGNTWYDRLAAACDKPTRAERQAEMAKIDRELKELQDKLKDWKTNGLSMLLSPRETSSQMIGHMLIALLLPAMGAATNAEDRGKTQFELNGLAFALAAYRADRAAYPEKLAALAPKYLAKLPEDPFSGSAYHYLRDGDGFLLYSVGMNGRDDGGKTRDDAKEGEGWDDITVRVPVPSQNK